MRRLELVALCLVLSVGWSMLAHANLVTNGGFETGDFTGWTISPDGVGIDTTFPNTDTYDAFLGTQLNTLNTPPGTLSQTITTAPGAYTLSFALLDEIGSPDDKFVVMFEGLTVANIAGDEVAAIYATRSLTVNATTGNPTLSFQGMNDSADWNLDDVSLSPVVTAIPEPPSVLLVGSVLVLSLGMVKLGHRRFRL